MVTDTKGMTDDELAEAVMAKLQELKEAVWDRLEALEKDVARVEERLAQVDALCAQRRDRSEQGCVQNGQAIGRLHREVDELRAQLHSVAEHVAMERVRRGLSPIVVQGPVVLKGKESGGE